MNGKSYKQSNTSAVFPTTHTHTHTHRQMDEWTELQSPTHLQCFLQHTHIDRQLDEWTELQTLPHICSVSYNTHTHTDKWMNVQSYKQSHKSATIISKAAATATNVKLRSSHNEQGPEMSFHFINKSDYMILKRFQFNDNKFATAPS